jgi:hypothetical protein
MLYRLLLHIIKLAFSTISYLATYYTYYITAETVEYPCTLTKNSFINSCKTFSNAFYFIFSNWLFTRVFFGGMEDSGTLGTVQNVLTKNFKSQKYFNTKNLLIRTASLCTL